MFSRVFVGFVLAGASMAAGAQTAAVALSEKSAEFGYSMLVGGQSFGRSELGFGMLYNSNDTLLADAGLQVVDEAGSKVPGLDVGVGGKVIAATLPNYEVLSLALGGQFRYAFRKAPRFAVGANAFYAPKIVSFLDMNNFWELSARVEYEVLPQAAAYLGYRNYAGRTTNDVAVEADEGFHLGMRISF